MKAKHTPGPWEIKFSASGYPYTITTPDTKLNKIPGRVGAQILRWGSFMLPSSDETLANARLIAASPDLLHALEMVRDADDDCKKDGLQTIPPAARLTIDRAIAKATGEQP